MCFQGDIELLQFANKPDIAYDMCITIAPNCGYEYRGPNPPLNNVFITEPNYHVGDLETATFRPVTQTVRPESQTTRMHMPRIDNSLDRNNDLINRTDDLWRAASSDLSTLRPNWPIENPYSNFAGQFLTSTDPGKIIFIYSKTNLCSLINLSL